MGIENGANGHSSSPLSAMKKSSGLKNVGGDTGKLIVYSDPDFQGEEHTFLDSAGKINETPWKGKCVKSLVIRGNPWLFYPDELLKGLPVFIEEGRYKDIETFNIPTSPKSIRLVKDDMGSPELYLASSTNFEGHNIETYPWERADLNVQLMKAVSVGPGGIFASQAKDESVWCRYFMQSGKATNKVNMGERGDGWSKIANGALRQLSVGTSCIWGVNADGRVMVRRGVEENSPLGKDWSTVDAEPMKHVSCSPKGHVWAVDNKEKIWYRKGACLDTPQGTNWKSISGSLKQVSAGNCGVWGINSEQCVFYRLNSYGDPDNEGTGWIKIEGKFQQIYSGANCVIALAGNRDIYFRAQVFEVDGVSASPNHEGTHWVRIEQPRDTKIIFKQIECTENTIWAVDKDNTIWFKDFTNIHEYLYPDYNFTLYGDQPEFFMYKFPERATTYKVNSGGWALYSEPNFQGKVMYHLGNDLLSNDPPNKENPYKSFFTQIGSARPIRGLNFRTPTVRIKMDWAEVKISSEKETLFSKEVLNESEDYIDAPWSPTHEVECTYSHNFTLQNKQEIRGTEFVTDRIEPLAVPIDNGPDILSGDEYIYQLTLPFIFKDEKQAIRVVKHTKVMKLPPLIPPRCTFKVDIVKYRGKFSTPFNAEFKLGFSPNFDYGSESWFDKGSYQGVDESNVKLEVTCIKFPPARKVSKMLNGLGDAM